MRLLIASIGVLLVAGCSSGAEAGSAPTVPSESGTPTVESPATSAAPSADEGDALRVAVQAYSDAYLTGAGEGAFSLLSQRCKDRFGAAQFGTMVGLAAEVYGSALPFTSYDAKISGDFARVTYTYDVASINQDSEPWVREDGQWHEDDC